MHQVPVCTKQACTAIDVQQRLQPDVIQQGDQVVTHRAGETGRFLVGLFGLFDGGACLQLLTSFIQGTAGLLQARRDAAQHDSSASIDVIKRSIKGLQIAF
ncbi:hypothetical protein D9M71_696820 [compost metagenome]